VLDSPAASIIFPTRGRPGYLEVALASIAPQARRAGAELVVVDDGAGDAAVERVARRFGARYETYPQPRGLNAARNAGIAAAAAPLLVFVDDDVEAPDGWLDALLRAAAEEPDHDVFGGPIRARLEGGGPPACGREPPPITVLDLGPADRDAEFVWGANMAVRRDALQRIGNFDPALGGCGDEEDWQRRLRTAGGRVRYVASAGLDHRRAAPDARIGALARAAHNRGRNARLYDVYKDAAPPLPAELRALAGGVWHTLRRRCAYGIAMTAHSAGRLAEALDPGPVPGPDYLSGHGGAVEGRRAALASAADAALDARARATGAQRRLARAAAESPPTRRVLVLGIDRDAPDGLMASARTELERSRHELSFALAAGTSGRGKFENLNALLADHPADGQDWLVVLDDDVALPPGFLDGALFLAERFELKLAQPAHRRRSHAAWKVTRRRAASVVRETAFVEIGPVTLFHADTFSALLPFPELAMGWGLDLHWAALARERGWRLGVIDALPVSHAQRPPAAEYSRERARAEAEAFLAERPYVSRDEAERTLAVHRGWDG
jgi:GT2 family glycosyltransferase